MTWRWHAADGGDSRLPRAAGSGPRWGAQEGLLTGGGRPAAAAHSARKRQKKLAENSEGGEPLHKEAGQARGDKRRQEKTDPKAKRSARKNRTLNWLWSQPGQQEKQNPGLLTSSPEEKEPD